MFVLDQVIRWRKVEEKKEFREIVEGITPYLLKNARGYYKALKINQERLQNIWEGWDYEAMSTLEYEMYEIWGYEDVLQGYYITYGQEHAVRVCRGECEGEPDIREANKEFYKFWNSDEVRMLYIKADVHQKRIKEILKEKDKIQLFERYCERRMEIQLSICEILMMCGYYIQMKWIRGKKWRDSSVPEAVRRYMVRGE